MPVSDGTQETGVSDNATLSLDQIARQFGLVVAEVGGLRGDINVLTAIVVRRDHTLAALLTEVRALKSKPG